MTNSVSICAAGTGQDYVTGIRVAVDGHDKASEQENKKKSQTIYMGGVGVENELTQKFAYEQKRALKKILDQLEQDSELAEDTKESGDKIMKLDEQVKKDRSTVQDIEEQKKTLQERYGVEPGSQEEKDLDLLRKQREHTKNPFDEQYKLTDEEKEYLADYKPTQYQQEMLMLDEAGREFGEKVSEGMRDMDVEEASIWATKKALLKVHPMVDAQGEAEDIMEAAINGLIDDLLEQMKDKLDEDTEEQQERIDEEKLEALEEKIRREELDKEQAEEEANREKMHESVFTATETAVNLSGQTIDSLQTDIKSLIQDQTFLDVDLKGLRVDKKL